MKKIISLILLFLFVTLMIPSYADSKITVYAPDGRSCVIWQSDLASWKNVGWYEYPVDTVYAPDGRTKVIAKKSVPSWEAVGWYTYPVTTVYAPDGRTEVIAKSAVDSWVAVGWSTTKPSSKKVSYYYGSTVPTYTSLAGIPQKDTIYLNNGIAYVYDYSKDTTPTDYIKKLCSDYGWTIYEKEKDYENMSLIVMLQKNNEYFIVMIDVDDKAVMVLLPY